MGGKLVKMRTGEEANDLADVRKLVIFISLFQCVLQTFFMGDAQVWIISYFSILKIRKMYHDLFSALTADNAALGMLRRPWLTMSLQN